MFTVSPFMFQSPSIKPNNFIHPWVNHSAFLKAPIYLSLINNPLNKNNAAAKKQIIVYFFFA